MPDLIANYEAWERSNRDANGLYWQIDDRDGMEVSIGGSGYRATINSYQFGDALAIARIAELAGKTDIASDFREKAAEIKKLVQEKLWDAHAQFFKVLPRGETQVARGRARTARFHALVCSICPIRQFAVAWKQVMDPQRLLRAVRADDGRATASEICGRLHGPRVPVERAESGRTRRRSR